MTVSGAMALSLGIAIQNFPEGTIISMPLRAAGQSKAKAFLSGTGSGAVEPAAALLTILFADLVVPVLPALLGFAAGAMLYVVVEELVPEMSVGAHSNVGVMMFALGFSVMMVLDVVFG
jgi:ZIP family zinc transporter